MTKIHHRSVALSLAAAALGLTAFAARPAEARLIDLRAGVEGGGITGWGATSNTPDFFDRRKGEGLGVDVGVKLLIFDVSANFFQVIDSNGREATLTQVLGGVNIDVPVGHDKFQTGIDRGHNKNILHPLAEIGFAAGTPAPVHPPLDNAQISDKGLVTYVGLGYEHFLTGVIAIGAEADYGYHYFTGGGKSMLVANQLYSSGTQLAGYATLTFHLGY
ncbi:MAG TPA: hypothetical protein VLA14_05680 [Polyangia bacterium]|jgi:hypothetical protein|nr:hypothetical protein [Polyangia bacterium]